MRLLNGISAVPLFGIPAVAFVDVVVDSLGVGVTHLVLVASAKGVWYPVTVHVGNDVCLVIRRRSGVLSHAWQLNGEGGLYASLRTLFLFRLMRTLERSEAPPQMPWSRLFEMAYSRQSICTGQRLHVSRASRLMRLCPLGGKNTDLSIPLHAAKGIHFAGGARWGMDLGTPGLPVDISGRDQCRDP